MTLSADYFKKAQYNLKQSERDDLGTERLMVHATRAMGYAMLSQIAMVASAEFPNNIHWQEILGK